MNAEIAIEHLREIRAWVYEMELKSTNPSEIEVLKEIYLDTNSAVVNIRKLEVSE